MMVDGKHLNDAQRIRLLVEMEDEDKHGRAPEQQELQLEDDVRYQWKDFHYQEEDPQRAMAAIVVAVVCSVPLMVLVLWWLVS